MFRDETGDRWEVTESGAVSEFSRCPPCPVGPPVLDISFVTGRTFAGRLLSDRKDLSDGKDGKDLDWPGRFWY